MKQFLRRFSSSSISSRVYSLFLAGFFLFHLITGCVNLLQKTYFYAVLSFCSLLLPVFLNLFWKILRIRSSDAMNLFIGVYFFLLYSIGIVLQGYTYIPLYDKFAHTLSGAVTAFGGLLLFFLLKPEKKFIKKELPLAAVFVQMTAMGIAALWEICEYVQNLIMHNDPQRVLTTGVRDTMLDMLVCSVGSLFFVGYLILVFRRNEQPFSRILQRFQEAGSKNPPEEKGSDH